LVQLISGGGGVGHGGGVQNNPPIYFNSIFFFEDLIKIQKHTIFFVFPKPPKTTKYTLFNRV